MKKQGELVILSTQDIRKSFPITTSLIVSKQFGKNHNQVLRDIRKLLTSLQDSLPYQDSSLYKIGQSEYINERGRSYPLYTMNERFFIMLVMGYNTEKAFYIKNLFINQFEMMKHEILIRSETRHIGVVSRKLLTESIDKNTPSGTFKNFAYSNYSRMVYKKVLGCPVNKFKDNNDISREENIRDYFDISTLEKIHDIESKIAGIIEFNKDIHHKDLYHKISQFVSDYDMSDS